MADLEDHAARRGRCRAAPRGGRCGAGPCPRPSSPGLVEADRALDERDLDALAVRSALLASRLSHCATAVSSSLPRSRRTKAGSLSSLSAWNVARTTLCGFADPIDLVSTFGMPHDSTTARTPPPAMMPVPSGAGFSSTCPAPKRPSTGCGTVVPLSGTRISALLRRLDPLLDRRGHFLRLADAEADDAVTVADDDQRAEAQVLAALDDLGDAADVDDRVLQVQLRGVDLFACFDSCLSCPKTPARLRGPLRPPRGCGRDRGSRRDRTRPA